MKGLNAKTVPFVVGALVGGLVGAVSVYVAIGFKDTENPQKEVVQKAPPKETHLPKDIDTSAVEDPNIEKQEKAKEKERNRNKEREDSVISDSIPVGIDTSNLVLGDTLPSNDSLLANTTEFIQDTTDVERISVRKDEMIASFNGDVIFLTKTIAEIDPIDSTLNNILEVRKDGQVKSYDVELWQSPINYRGYKLGKNKLLLYGIRAEDSVQLYHRNENTYLKTTTNVFRLQLTEDFKSYEIVRNDSILNALKQ
jgi:hypothetical protein